MQGIRGGYDKIPKALSYLLKGDYMRRSLLDVFMIPLTSTTWWEAALLSKLCVGIGFGGSHHQGPLPGGSLYKRK